MLLLLFATPGAVEPPEPPDTAPFWYGLGPSVAFPYGDQRYTMGGRDALAYPLAGVLQVYQLAGQSQAYALGGMIQIYPLAGTAQP